jgi:hypothetical protein
MYENRFYRGRTGFGALQVGINDYNSYSPLRCIGAFTTLTTQLMLALTGALLFVLPPPWFPVA